MERLRLSNLPDPILRHILSLLPTKTVVSCGFLSKKWRSLSTSLSVRDIRIDPQLKHFLSTILSLHTHANLHHLAVLKLTSSEPNAVTWWHSNTDLLLFPNLKVLHLTTCCLYRHSFQNFLSGCPLLRDLLLRNFVAPSEDHLTICVPTLTSFVAEDVPNLVLDTPALHYLHFNHWGSNDSLVALSLCNLTRADIDCSVLIDGSRLLNLLTTLSTVKFLKLSWITVIGWPSGLLVHGIANDIDYSSMDALPVFHNLIRLELNIPSCDCVVLPHFLHKFHNLESISIDKKFDREVIEPCWKEPAQVPICLSSRLSF